MTVVLCKDVFQNLVGDLLSRHGLRERAVQSRAHCFAFEHFCNEVLLLHVFILVNTGELASGKGAVAFGSLVVSGALRTVRRLEGRARC